jgi:hypothetical protein
VADGLAAIADTDEAVFGTGLVALGLRALADEAVAQRDHRSRTRRAAARDQLLATLDSIRAMPGQGDLPEAAALDLQCRAEQARLDHAPATQLWADTAVAWAGLDRPLPTAYARWREAESRLSAGAKADAIGLLRSVHTQAQLLGAVCLVSELETLARWYRVDLLPAVTETTREAGSEALEAYALTAREREVLGLVAEGMSNKQVAAALFLSAKTVEHHLARVYAKRTTWRGCTRKSAARPRASSAGSSPASAPASRPDRRGAAGVDGTHAAQTAPHSPASGCPRERVRGGRRARPAWCAARAAALRARRCPPSRAPVHP